MSKSLRSPRHKKLQQVLIAARLRGGWTQQEVAARLGKPQSFVAKYEGGERRLDLVELIDVALALGCKPAVIVEEVEHEEKGGVSTAIEPEA